MKAVSGWLSFQSSNSVHEMQYIDVVGEAQADAELDFTRAFNFDLTNVTSQGTIDMDGDNLAMAARLGGAYHKRIDCGSSDTGVPEQGLVVRLDLEITVPTQSEGEEYKRATIHDIILYNETNPPVSHEQDLVVEESLEEIE